MNRKVLIIGAGMGGLTAALRLARRGFSVQIIEARNEAGGLASGGEIEGLSFDAGPYILLDRPGLEAAFQAVGLELADQIELRRIESVYEVRSQEGAVCRFFADEAETAAGFEHDWPGSGARYRRFIAGTRHTYERLRPLLQRSRPTPLDLLRAGAWREAPFLLRSLGVVLARTGLPRPIQNAIGIWTHIAGEGMNSAPSPLAFVPSLIHTAGAYYPVGGIHAIPRVLTAAAVHAGVDFRYDTSIRTIRSEAGRVTGAETTAGEFVPADAIISNAGGIGTYCELLDAPPPTRERLARLPLQSPGVCAYLAVRGTPKPPYLRFSLPGGDELCRLLIQPAVMDAGLTRDGWQPARLLSPMRHETAERLGEAGQRAYLDKMLAETWWREGIAEFRVLATRAPTDWGAQFHLYRDSMNPVMTARFMRQGRLAHRSPYVRGLYLAGSATHPGQWVSFCALSGILAADCVCEDSG